MAKKSQGVPTGLRQRAEQQLAKNKSALSTVCSGKDTLKLVHELEVHQIELEMQNAELNQSRSNLEASLHSYTDLYDFSPAGYFNLDRDGIIRAANLTGSRLLGIERDKLSGQPFVRFVAPESQPVFAGFLDKLRMDAETISCELTIAKKGQAPLIVQLAALANPTEAEFRIAVIDITKRKKAEEAQLVSEKIYRTIGEAIDYGIWICDPIGRNIYASDSFLRLVGLTQEQCSNFGWGDVLHPDDAERTIAAWQECVRTEGVWDIEHRFRGQDGNWHYILARGLPVRNERGEIICWSGINLDISRLKKSESALLRQKELLNNALDELHIEKNFLSAVLTALPVGVAITDLDGGSIRANEAYELIWGENRPDVQTVDDYAAYKAWWLDSGKQLTPEEWASVIAIQQGIAVTGQLLRIQRFDGNRAYVINSAAPVRDSDENIVGCAVAIQDVTQLIATEELLRQNEQRLLLTLDAARMGTWELHVPSSFVKWSKLVNVILGYQAGEMEPSFQAFLSRVHPDDREAALSRIESCIASKQSYSSECRALLPDGTVRWLESRGECTYDENDSPLLFYGVVHDVTERRMQAEALQAAHDELEEKVSERTRSLQVANEQLRNEVAIRKSAEMSLQNAYAEIKALKDRFEAENIYLQHEIAMEHNFGEIVGQSSALMNVVMRIQQVAAMNATVLLLGETGTGKGVVARAIHGLSCRSRRPMITVNCSSLPANLIESELFGRERGAFTGANERQIGRFELADGGTILLDEIGEMPLELQSKLLRVIQDGEFERLGSSRTIKVDVRIIAASNRNLSAEIKCGRFREDLFYRLNVFPIEVPPLRQRQEDIPLLINHFISKFNKKNGKQIEFVSQQTMNNLQEYHWPGNIRELESVIERAVIVSQGKTLQILDRFEPHGHSGDATAQDVKFLADLERDHILQVLQNTGWRIEGQKGAALLLGLNPSTLRARMRKFGIKR